MAAEGVEGWREGLCRNTEWVLGAGLSVRVGFGCMSTLRRSTMEQQLGDYVSRVLRWWLCCRCKQRGAPERSRQAQVHTSSTTNPHNTPLHLAPFTQDGTLPPQPAGPYPGAYGGAPGEAPAYAAAAAAAAASTRELTLRDLVVRFAEEQGVEFQPKPGRMHEGLQVYGFGPISVVLDNVGGVIRAQIGSRWAPVALEQLLQLAVARRGK